MSITVATAASPARPSLGNCLLFSPLLILTSCVFQESGQLAEQEQPEFSMQIREQMRDHHQEPEDVPVVQIQGGLSLIQHALFKGESTSDVLCRWCNSMLTENEHKSSGSEVGQRPEEQRQTRCKSRGGIWRTY